MKRILWCTAGLGCLLASILACSQQPCAAPSPAAPKRPVPLYAGLASASHELRQLAENDREFASTLYRRCARSERADFIISPLGVRVALAIAASAAKRQEIPATWRPFGISPEATGQLAARWDAQDQDNSQEHTFRRLSTSLWVQQGAHPTPQFIQELAAYGGSLHEVDLQNHRMESLAAIDQWASKLSDGDVAALFNGRGTAPAMRLAMATIADVRQPWRGHFKRSGWGAFADTSSGVPMMRGDARVRFGTRPIGAVRATTIALPLAGGDMEMIVLLPDRTQTLSQLEGELTGRNLDEAIASTEPHTLDLALPMFELASDWHLEVAALGDQLNRADFSAIAADPPLELETAIHGVKIRVDDRGVNARNAPQRMSVGSVTAREIVDRPFAFFVLDSSLGVVLLAGRVISPETLAIPDGSSQVDAGAPEASAAPQAPPRVCDRPTRPSQGYLPDRFPARLTWCAKDDDCEIYPFTTWDWCCGDGHKNLDTAAAINTRLKLRECEESRLRQSTCLAWGPPHFPKTLEARCDRGRCRVYDLGLDLDCTLAD